MIIIFSETLTNYSIEVKRIAEYLLDFMSKNLGLKRENLSHSFKDGMQSMRINYYPPCLKPEKVIGLSPHSDAVGLTILLQVSEMPGLQIRRNGRWLAIKPLSGAFIVNIGDVIEVILHNGLFGLIVTLCKSSCRTFTQFYLVVVNVYIYLYKTFAFL